MTIYRQATRPLHRKRAKSLFYQTDGNSKGSLLSDMKVYRVQSDSDIKHSIYNNNGVEQEMSQPSKLLARVFTALGNITDDESVCNLGGFRGVHGLSDSEIMEDESHVQRINGSLSITSRSRAASEFQPPFNEQWKNHNQNEWTWCGDNNQIEEFLKIRKLNKKKSKDLYRASFAVPNSSSSRVFCMNERSARSKSIFNKLSTLKAEDQREFKTDKLKSDSCNVYIASNQFEHMSQVKRRQSTFSSLSTTKESDATVLEKTTIADLIRALEIMHTQAIAGSPVEHKRKLGTSDTPIINILTAPTQLRTRRGSVRPMSQLTDSTLRSGRRQSTILDNLPSNRKSSYFASVQSTEMPINTEKANKRRFSVRATQLNSPLLTSLQARQSTENYKPTQTHSDSSPTTRNRNSLFPVDEKIFDCSK